MAFVCGQVAALKFTNPRSAACKRRASAIINMAYKTKDGKTVVTMRDLEAEQPQGGFTFYSEKWNGRMAMLGFLIAITDEVFNPSHPTIAHQVGLLFGQ